MEKSSQMSMGNFYNFGMDQQDKTDSPRNTLVPIKEAEGAMSHWMDSSFPVLCQLLDNVTSLIPETGKPHFETSAAKAFAELEAVFPAVMEIRKHDADIAPYDKNIPLNMPLFSKDKKIYKQLETAEPSKKVIPVIFDDNPVLLDHDFGRCACEPLPTELCLVQAHDHHCRSPSTGLLQVCSGQWTNVYRKVDNFVREMDHIIQNPETNLCRDALESSLELELPGLFTYQFPAKQVTFNSNRNGMDVLGLIMVLVDSVYATNSLTQINHKGVVVPIDFTQNIVKVVSIVRKAFPELFSELQKLIMYSTVLSVLKKLPFRWNRFMIHVLEDLIVHPLKYINEESIEFKLLMMIVRKRAKVLFKRFSPGNEAHIFDSLNHKNVISSNFTHVYKKQIAVFLHTSASNCKIVHRVKNIKYKVKDARFESRLRDLVLSYLE